MALVSPSALAIRGDTTVAFRQNLGPGTLLHRIYSNVGQRLAKKADQIAQHLGLGPEATTQRIQEAFGDKKQTLLKLVELYDSRKNKAVVSWTLPVVKYCNELVGYTLCSEASETRLQAFNCIITLIVFYPGLRPLLLLSKALKRAGESQNAVLLALWECDGPSSKEWEYKRRIAAAILSEDELGTLIETTQPDILGYVDGNGSGSVIEKLLSVIDCDGVTTHSGAIAIRYLGGILRLSSFWLKTNYPSHSSVATKLFRGLEGVLKDIGVDIVPSDNTDATTPEAVMDLQGVDYLGEVILAGTQTWATHVKAEGSRSPPCWWEGFRAVIRLLRRPRAKGLLPRSWGQVSSSHFEKLLLRSSSNYEEYDSFTDNKGGSDDAIPAVGEPEENEPSTTDTSTTDTSVDSDPHKLNLEDGPRLSRTWSQGPSNDAGDSLAKKYGVYQKTAIGKGATSVVRLAHKWDRSEEKLYAIKEFHKRRKNESEKAYVKKLTTEFCISSTLHHPNIVKTIDLIQDENQNWCQVMEFCPGGDLYTAVKKGGMSPSEIECCFKQILKGVEYLHSQGVAHRDIKPENLFFDTTGRLRIGDYGSSTVYRLPWEDTIHMSTGLCGNGPYIAPEIFLGKPYVARLVDIWACGMVYYFLHSQGFPWRQAQPATDRLYSAYATTCSRSLFTASANPPAINNLGPRACRSLIRKMLEPDPRQRLTIEDVVAHAWIKGIDVCYETSTPHHVHVNASLVDIP